MPVTLLDSVVPVAILLCGLAFIGIRRLGFATAHWGYALCCLSIGYALLLFETGRATPFKQIVEDNFILLAVIMVSRALKDRRNIRSILAFEIAVVALSSLLIAISLSVFDSIPLETLCVQALCSIVLWEGVIRFRRKAAGTADKVLATTFLFLAILLSAQFVVYLILPAPPPVTGAWRSSLSGNMVQYTGLIGSIILAFAVMIATSFDAIEKYRQHANTDPLTGLLNRRGLDAFLASGRGRRFGGPATAVILADIDHFKTINDRFGHPFGDRVIDRFGALLKAQAGAHGCVVRLGGEEFGVLLPDIQLDDAAAAADRMRRAFMQERWRLPGKGEQFTASFGVTMVEQDEAMSATIERADALMYLAKQSGRNCIVARPAATAAECGPIEGSMASVSGG